MRENKTRLTLKEILKIKMTPTSKNIRAGRFMMFTYDAKNKKNIYDKTPICLVLSHSKSYVLGINIHWCPRPMRKTLVKFIFKINEYNIKHNRPLKVEWQKLKPFVHKIGGIPILRLYIKKRMSRQSILIPIEKTMDILDIRSETFTGVNENVLYMNAIREYRNKARI